MKDERQLCRALQLACGMALVVDAAQHSLDRPLWLPTHYLMVVSWRVTKSEHARFENNVDTTLLPVPTLSGEVLSLKATQLNKKMCTAICAPPFV